MRAIMDSYKNHARFGTGEKQINDLASYAKSIDGRYACGSTCCEGF